MRYVNISEDVILQDSSDDSDSLTPISSFVLEGVLLVLAGLVGIAGNLSAVVVFGGQRVQKNFHALMVSLAVFDLTYILVSIFVFSLPHFFPDFNTSAFYCISLPFVLPFAQIGLTGSIFFTMAVTVERYFTVCHPFYRASHSWSAKVYIVPILLFAFTYNIPKFFELDSSVFAEESFRQAFVFYMTNGSSPDWDSAESLVEAREYVSATNGPNFLAEINSSNNTNRNIYQIACSNLTNGRINSIDELPSQEPTKFLLKHYRPFFSFSKKDFYFLKYMSIPTPLRLNQAYVEIFCGWINFFVHNLFPYALLISMNTIILRRLESFSRQEFDDCRGDTGTGFDANGSATKPGYRRNTSTSTKKEPKKKEVQLAKISLVIVVVFIICHSFRWIANVYELYLFHLSKNDDVQVLEWPQWVEITSHISHFLTVVNSSVNFYIYLFKHPSILPFCRKKNESTESIAMATLATALPNGDDEERHQFIEKDHNDDKIEIAPKTNV